MRFLITGSSGHIGSHVAAVLSRHGTCLGVDVAPGRFTSHVGSITDRGLIARVMPGVDAVVHSAAYLTPHVGVKSEDDFRDVNVHGTEVLLDAAVQHNVPRFVFTSTTSVYGCTSRPKSEAIWVTEDLSPNPEDIYDFTKLEAERLCREASRMGISAVILRMSRCFAEPDHLRVFYRLYRGVGPWDVAEAHWLAASSTVGGAATYNISADPPFLQTERRELLENPWHLIERVYPGAAKLFDEMKWEKPASIDRVYVIEKAKRLLNYQPRENFWEFLQSRVARIRGPSYG